MTIIIDYTVINRILEPGSGLYIRLDTGYDLIYQGPSAKTYLKIGHKFFFSVDNRDFTEIKIC